MMCKIDDKVRGITDDRDTLARIAALQPLQALQKLPLLLVPRQHFGILLVNNQSYKLAEIKKQLLVTASKQNQAGCVAHVVIHSARRHQTPWSRDQKRRRHDEIISEAAISAKSFFGCFLY